MNKSDPFYPSIYKRETPIAKNIYNAVINLCDSRVLVFFDIYLFIGLPIF